MLVCDNMKRKPHVFILRKLWFLEPDYLSFQILCLSIEEMKLSDM